MTARKAWSDLTPATRAKRIAPILNNHVPVATRTVVPMSVKHAKCRDSGRCTGPGCVVNRGAW